MEPCNCHYLSFKDSRPSWNCEFFIKFSCFLIDLVEIAWLPKIFYFSLGPVPNLTKYPRKFGCFWILKVNWTKRLDRTFAVLNVWIIMHVNVIASCYQDKIIFLLSIDNLCFQVRRADIVIVACGQMELVKVTFYL